MSKIDLRCGDCLEKMKEIPDNSVDLTVTSPPYDNLRNYNGNIDQWNFEKFKLIAEELYRVTSVGGTLVWIVGDATKNGNETCTSFKQALWFKECGFNLLDTMIYEKNGCGACGSNKCYIQNFEYMFVFTKGKIKTYNLICDRKNKVVGEQKVNTNRDKYTADNGRKYRNIKSKEYGRRFNIWKYNQTSGQDEFSKKHPAPFSTDLAKDHIISWSNENDTVLDCFMGSGTTGVVCKELNRNFIGIELDENYFNLAKERIEKG